MRTKSIFLILALLILLPAFGLRIYRLQDQSLWYDEALSVYYALQPLSKMFAGVSGSDHPPLHSLMLHFWMPVAGQSEFALRYLSLWWGVLSVALLYCLGRLFFDRLTGSFAAALLALSPFHIWYSQEARMYSLALTLSLGVVLALLKIITRHDSSTGPWAVYVFTASLALYAHFYTGFILLFANVVFGIWWLWMANRKGWRAARGLLARWILSQVIILALFVPWGRFAAEQLAFNATYWHGALSLVQIIRDTALAFVAGDRVIVTPLAQAGTLAMLLLALLGLVMAAQSSDKAAIRVFGRGERALYLFLWLAVPVAAIFVISHQRPKFAPRYLLSALPAMLLLTSKGGASLALMLWESEPSLGQRFRRWLAGGVLLLGGLLIAGVIGGSLYKQYFDKSLARPDFRAVGDYITRHAEPNDTVLLVGGHSYPAFDYYFDGDIPVHPLPPGLLPSTREPLDYHAVSELAEIAAGRERLWLVLWQDRLADPTEVILSHLLLSCPRLDVNRSFHDMALLLFSTAECELAAQPGPTVPLRVEFGEQMRLLGYDLSPPAVVPGTVLNLTLYWEAMGEVSTNYTTFAQVIGPMGSIYAQHDMLTGADAYPTLCWQPGAKIRNAHRLALSSAIPPGSYDLIVGLYVNEGKLSRLPISYPVDIVGDAFLLSKIQVGK